MELYSEEPFFEKVLNLLVYSAKKRYGISVSFVGDQKFKGDLSGKEIVLSEDLSPSIRLGYFLHLFGHTVQWNQPDFYENYGNFLKPKFEDKTEEEFQEIYNYEYEAAQYALHFVESLEGHVNFEESYDFVLDWFSRFAITDLKYLEIFYRNTKNKDSLDFAAIWKEVESSRIKSKKYESFSAKEVCPLLSRSRLV